MKAYKTLAAIALFCGAACPAIALSDSDLGQLERQLFHHDNHTLADQARLSKLEDMVFGTERTGTDDERLNRLKGAISIQPGSQSSPQSQADYPTQSVAPALSSTDRSVWQSGSLPSSAAESRVSRLPVSSPKGWSPAIAAKKQGSASSIPYTPYNATSPQVSSARFPSGSNNRLFYSPPPQTPAVTAQGSRISAAWAHSNSAASGGAQNAGYPPSTWIKNQYQGASPPAWGQSQPGQQRTPMVAELSALERQVYGRESSSQPVIQRVQQLERTLYPGTSVAANQPLPTRIDNLAVAARAGRYWPSSYSSSPYRAPSAFSYAAPSASSYSAPPPSWKRSNSTLAQGATPSPYPGNQNMTGQPQSSKHTGPMHLLHVWSKHAVNGIKDF